jgi:hypothetical protein
MPKDKRRKSKLHKSRARQPRRPPPTQPPERRFQIVGFSVGRTAWKTVGVVSLVVGLFVSLLALLPWFSIDIDEPLDPGNPFSSPFYLVSESYLPLYNIQVTRLFTSETQRGIRFLNMGVRCTEPIKKLSYKKKVALPCLHAIRVQDATMAALILSVSYQPFGLPFRREQQFRFRSEPRRDGTLQWIFNN